MTVRATSPCSLRLAGSASSGEPGELIVLVGHCGGKTDRRARHEKQLRRSGRAMQPVCPSGNPGVREPFGVDAKRAANEEADSSLLLVRVADRTWVNGGRSMRYRYCELVPLTAQRALELASAPRFSLVCRCSLQSPSHAGSVIGRCCQRARRYSSVAAWAERPKRVLVLLLRAARTRQTTVLPANMLKRTILLCEASATVSQVVRSRNIDGRLRAQA